MTGRGASRYCWTFANVGLPLSEAGGDAKAARLGWCGVTMQRGEVVLLASVQSAMELGASGLTPVCA